MNDDDFDAVLHGVMRETGHTAAGFQTRIRRFADSLDKAIRAENAEAARREIESWPEWKRNAVKAQLNQPYVEPPDRGEDGNARW